MQPPIVVLAEDGCTGMPAPPPIRPHPQWRSIHQVDNDRGSFSELYRGPYPAMSGIWYFLSPPAPGFLGAGVVQFDFHDFSDFLTLIGMKRPWN